MKLQFDTNLRNLEPYAVTLIRQPEYDQRVKNESHLLHLLKVELLHFGGDWIKKRMWKDGNLVSDHCQYVRMRKPVNGRMWAIWDESYAVRDAAEDYRKEGQVTLQVRNLIDKGGDA